LLTGAVCRFDIMIVLSEDCVQKDYPKGSGFVTGSRCRRRTESSWRSM
jgi:hypothetical protein